MNKLSLTFEDFSSPDSRLNTSGFTDTLQKSSESGVLNRDQFLFFSSHGIERLIADSKQLEKGGSDFQTTHLVNKIVNNMFHMTVRGQSVFAVDKSLVFGSDFSKGVEEDVLEKGISDLRYETSQLKFKKTGAELKAALGVLKQSNTDQLSEISLEMDKVLEAITITPTETPYVYGNHTLKQIWGAVTPKKFSWGCTYWDNKTNDYTVGYNTESNRASSKEESLLCDTYNTLHSRYQSISCDNLDIDFYLRNLEDKKTYELTSNVLISLGM